MSSLQLIVGTILGEPYQWTQWTLYYAMDTSAVEWITNITISFNKVDLIANGGGRVRWKIENEGFNVQKNGGYNLEHAYSREPNERKDFYLLLQIAHLIFQLIEKGSLFRKAFPKGVRSQRNLAKRILEAWRNLSISACDFCNLGEGRFQIRFDTS